MSVQSQISKCWLSVLIVVLGMSAVDAGAQNAAIVRKPSVHVQSASDAVKDSRLLHLTVINVSGQRRQALVGKQWIDLPIGRAVGLDWTPGDTLRVVSDTDSRVNERINVSRADAAHAIAIR